MKKEYSPIQKTTAINDVIIDFIADFILKYEYDKIWKGKCKDMFRIISVMCEEEEQTIHSFSTALIDTIKDLEVNPKLIDNNFMNCSEDKKTKYLSFSMHNDLHNFRFAKRNIVRLKGCISYIKKQVEIRNIIAADIYNLANSIEVLTKEIENKENLICLSDVFNKNFFYRLFHFYECRKVRKMFDTKLKLYETYESVLMKYIDLNVLYEWQTVYKDFLLKHVAVVPVRYLEKRDDEINVIDGGEHIRLLRCWTSSPVAKKLSDL